MAVKSKLNEDVLAKLGAKKLAELALDEAQRNTPFRRRLSAALAARKGPDAVAAIVDRRLMALERAHGFIDWEGNKAFTEELRAMLTIITDELGKTDPDAAIDRIVRFLNAAGSVFDRIDDSNGHVQNVFYLAADAIPGLATTLSVKRKASLPDRLHHCVTDNDYGFCSDLLEKLLPILPAASIEAWDHHLADETRSLGVVKANDGDWRRRTKFDRLIRLRQVITDHQGDCDTFIALEQSRCNRQPDTLAVAERLLKAGRHSEALKWVRKPGLRRATVPVWEDGTDLDSLLTSEQVRLELRILDAKGEAAEAQKLRWSVFLETLDVNLLREYVARLGDFEEFEVLDRAFAHAAAFKDKLRALGLFVSWPRLDLASLLVLDNEERWDGRRYDTLLPAAEALEEPHPVAATILYRALLDHILDQGRSQAYGHAARYFARLDALGSHIPADTDRRSHATYKAELQRKHGRKSGFWAQVDVNLR
ncbi:MAG: DUF6880 family protein [Rhizomicrobium sp.]